MYGHENDPILCTDMIISNRPNYFKQHEIEQNMELIRTQGYKDGTPSQYVNVEIPVISETEKPIIGLHCGSFGGGWEKKRWPYFKTFAMKLIYNDFIVINFGTEEDKLNIENENYIENAGKLTLQETIDNIVGMCDYFISNDSGLMHVVDAFEIPLIALFGPTLITKNRPVAKNSHVLVNNLDCIPCQYSEDFSKCQDNKCLKEIKSDNIINYMNKLGWNE